MKKDQVCIKGIIFIILVYCIANLFANDMTLQLEDDVEVILHDDHTWDYTSQSPSQMASDNSVVIDNGDVIQIKTDHTWNLIEKGYDENLTTESEELGSAYSVGNANGPDQYIANNTAIDAAIEHLAKQLISATGNNKLTIERLCYCIKEEDKSIQIQEKQKNNIWQVQVNLALDAEQIKAVLECANDD